MVVEDCGYPNNNQSYFSINSPYSLKNVSHQVFKNEADLTPVQQFYNETKIFITGSTGFLGKILVEKLLRSCPGINTIYLLIRSKKGKNLEERVDHMFEDVIFDRLKRECPKFRHKIVGVAGDCALPNLGLSIEDTKLLTDTVNLVFHVAATVRFEEKLTTAVAINLRAPRDIFRLAKQMKNLKAVVQVSTIYANCLHQYIEEKTYPPAMDPEKLIMMAENIPEDIMDEVTPKLLGKFPNTYTYTKQIAESIVVQECKNMPAGIFRPAIVISTYKEPLVGWINNLYGPTGVIAGAGVGLLRTLHCDHTVNANLVPVDMCVNSLILSARDVALKFQNAQWLNGTQFDTPVYNYGSTNEKPITWGTFKHLSEFHGFSYPPVKAIWYYSFGLYKYYPVYLTVTFLLHTLPALLTDAVLFCIGQKPKMMQAYKKIHKFSKVISHFSTHEWQIQTDNVRRLQDGVGEKDHSIFFSDLLELDWDEFYHHYWKGVRVYLLQDPMDTIERATIRLRRLHFAHQAVKLLLFMALLWLFLWLVRLVVW